MIDVVNLSKIYKDKKAADVAAVDGVTFSLPERGMVFILGKSGCGKSTLLNVLGGLDGFDGGDVIVDGKPLSVFSQKDCDIYRSEYVGFVFQENNLLDEYTVEANVALALSVNGINDNQRVKEALADVQLEEYGGRKPNRLSGGQKQRVAIARAIVKQPKLLLCDEPTGALDSDTGEAIFQLLKNISKNTLVVVVTHDRESAQLYGDRIIELKNGKIISDSVNRKADITADEKGKRADISEGIKEVKNTKRHGSMPARTVFPFGARMLAARPVRLALCVIICLIAFGCLGVSDAVNSYTYLDALQSVMDTYGCSYVSFVKGKVDKYGYTSTVYSLEDYDIETLNGRMDGRRVDYVYNGYFYGEYTAMDTNDISNYYYYTNYGFAEIDDSFLDDYGYSLAAGRLPQADDEALITMFTFNNLVKYSVDGSIKTYDDVLYSDTNPFELGIYYSYSTSYSLKITGILDTKYNYGLLGDYLDGKAGDSAYLYSEVVRGTARSSLHDIVYLRAGYYEDVIVSGAAAGETIYSAGFAVTPYCGSAYNKAAVLAISGDNYTYGDAEYTLQIITEASVSLNGADDTVTEFFQPLFMWVAVGTVIISVFMLLYYASGVVQERSREIGILRALGARKGDIAKIFGVNCGLFDLGIIILASLGAFAAAAVVNSLVQASFIAAVSVISFGIRQIALLAVVAVLATAAGVAIPMVRLIKAKPVDVMSGRKK